MPKLLRKEILLQPKGLSSLLPPPPPPLSMTVPGHRTMESLQMEKTKREKELNQIRQSEPKLIREIAGLKESMMRMNEEMKVASPPSL
jgi:hypothetical protein